jgi:hypothetical protein
MNQPIHILNQMGIITSFSVAKKITEDEIHKFFNRGKRSGKTDAEIEKMLKEKVLNEIHEAIIQQKIPGLLTSQDVARAAGLNKNIVDNVPELNRLIMVIAHKLSEKKYDKMSLCYFINSMVNILGLQETDFEKFHRQNNNDDDDDDDNEPKNA